MVKRGKGIASIFPSQYRGNVIAAAPEIPDVSKQPLESSGVVQRAFGNVADVGRGPGQPVHLKMHAECSPLGVRKTARAFDPHVDHVGEPLKRAARVERMKTRQMP